jgi:undecaprenyl-diphosphatase
MSIDEYLGRLDQQEIRAVRGVAAVSRRSPVLTCCRGASRLGDGWLYLGALALALWTEGTAAWPMLLSSSLAVGLAFIPYLWLKPSLKRARPYAYEPSLNVGAPVLDRYSCPSGHCMTLSAAGIPIAWVHPVLTPVVVVAFLILAWARVALGHHYPSDLLVGMILGATSGLFVSFAML